MPMPNFHTCEIRPSSDFQPRRATLKRGKVQLIIGKLKGQTKTTLQSIHYPVSSWDAEKARTDCKKKGGRFVAARKADQ